MSAKTFWPKLRLSLFFALVLATLMSLLVSYKILIENFLKQISSSYGLSDEGFLLGMLRTRSQGNTENYIWPFAEVLRILFEISGGNILLYRLIGIIIIATLFCYLISLTMKANLDKFILALVATLIFTLFVTFPTPYSFLLITPGYQWIVIVSSTFITLLMIIRKNLLSFNQIEIIFINFLVVGSILARPTSGLVILALLGIYSAPQMKYFLMRFLLPQFFVWATVFFLNILNLRGRFSELYIMTQVVDPNGYNLLNEIIDIGVPFLFCAAAINLGFLISLKVGSTTPLEKYQKYWLGVSIVAVMWLLTLEVSKSKLILFLGIYALLLGCLSFVVFQKIEIVLKLHLLSFSPFFSQFGSNISSLANSLYLFLSLSIFFVSLLINIEKTRDYTQFKFNVQLGVISILFLNSFIYVNYVNGINNATFEKSVGEFASTKALADGLMYNESRLQKLDSFKSQANIVGRKVTDLSFWHPGLITFAGGYPDGWYLADDYFIDSIDRQFSFLIERNNPRMFSKDSLILLESGNPEKPSSICLPITKYIINITLKETIIRNKVNVPVQLITTYESSPEDSTLYPNYAVLVKVC